MRLFRRRDDAPSGFGDTALVTEMVRTLGDTRKWTLTADQWQEVDQLLVVIENAVAARDTETLRRAGADLELAESVRITRIGSVPRVPPPERVRERVNRLIHSLTGTDAGAPTEKDDDGHAGHR
ncbi:hypothetical protein OG792_05700 [Micromonospora sp. NBC_01699]|uniref:CATRA system-associated protein n=1 Tax=Micromonospora sp. NBC_01699 TaxID=2975984 RepID=UPI002E3186FF|nr:CATRA system-associated protein [Micromonospora sp. NBC_01699]